MAARARFVYALVAALAAAPAAHAVPMDVAARLDACLKKTATAPDEAYEDGLIWAREGGGVHARHCAAVALIAKGEVETGAERLAALAAAPDVGDPATQIVLLTKAANAWMLLRRPEEATRALDVAIGLSPDDPDLYVDRARAAALRLNWRGAEDDLARAIGLRADTLAYVLRAEARLRQFNLDGAEADAAEALALAPQSVDALVVRGHVREARRTGRLPE